MAVETLDLLEFLVTWVSASVLFTLWQLDRLPAAVQTILDFLSGVFVFLGLAPVGDAAAAPPSPRRPLPAPALPPSSPLVSSGRPYIPLDVPKTLPVFAWERKRTLASSRPLAQENVDRLFPRHDARVARATESKQKKTVRFAAVTRVQVISPRRSAAHPEPVSTPASPPVVEPFDAVAWAERLRAFHEAISMPNCSMLPDPKLLYGVAPLAPQHAPVWWPEMPQAKPAPARSALPPPSSPKTTSAPPSASSSSATTTNCAPEMQQPKPAARPAAPPPSSPPKITSAPTPAPSSSTTATASEPEKPQQAPPPSSPPAATPVQDPSAVAEPRRRPSPPSSPPPQQSRRKSSISAPSPPSPACWPRKNLTPAQQAHRTRMQAAFDFLEHVDREAQAAGGQTAEKSRALAWQGCVRGLAKQNALGEIAAGLRVVFDTAHDDHGGLRESVFPRGELGKILLTGEKIRELLAGFEAGLGIVRNTAVGDIGPLFQMTKVLSEMSNFFWGY